MLNFGQIEKMKTLKGAIFFVYNHYHMKFLYFAFIIKALQNLDIL